LTNGKGVYIQLIGCWSDWFFLEQIGAQVIEDLSNQRETIQRSRSRVCT